MRERGGSERERGMEGEKRVEGNIVMKEGNTVRRMKNATFALVYVYKME